MLLDGRGRQMSSEELAAWLGKRRDEGCAARRLLYRTGEWMV